MGECGAPTDGQPADELRPVGDESDHRLPNVRRGEVAVAYERGIEALLQQRRQARRQRAHVLVGQVGEAVDAGSCLDLAQQGDRAVSGMTAHGQGAVGSVPEHVHEPRVRERGPQPCCPARRVTGALHHGGPAEPRAEQAEKCLMVLGRCALGPRDHRCNSGSGSPLRIIRSK